jgi:hypothetical protein
MPQPITLLTAGLLFVVLFTRYRSRPKDASRPNRKKHFKTAKLLIAAVVAWLAIHYSMQRTLARMDGADPEPSLIERVVSFVSK